ncbi:MAG: O-antigen ligase family protein [Acidobacteriota bacterium]
MNSAARFSQQPILGFYVGLALVMLALWLFFIPNWLTFVHQWRVELFASIFLFFTLSFVFLKAKKIDTGLLFSKAELRLIIIPLLAFISWSAASVIWAASWKSAVHHTFVWSEYLIFYCIVRYLLEQKGHYKRFMYLFTVVLLLYALPAVAGFVALSTFGGTNGLGVGFARFGEQVLCILPLILIAVVHLKGRDFALGVLVAACLSLFIFSTFGRTNYLLFSFAVVAIGGVIFLLRRFRVYRIRFAVTAAAMILATVAASSLSMFSLAEKPPNLNRFQNSDGLAKSNNFRKLMVSLSAEMIVTHPMTGIGADNFGFEVNRYRELYAARNPSDPNLENGENELPERAHNEYLQIFAELGLIGIAIFAWFLTGIGILGIRLLGARGTRPLQTYGAIIGIVLFLASSIVTSYSFRLIQNGFVFFFVLAVAARLLFRRKQELNEKRAANSLASLRIAVVAGMAACFMLAVYSSVRVASVILTEKANQTTGLDEATEAYHVAMRLDDENPFASKGFGMRLFHEGRYGEAAEHLSRAVEMGLGTSTDFSYLASAFSLSGNNEAAEDTMRRAARYYPRSVFVLVRYAVLLRQNDKETDSEDALARASRISPNSAKTWLALITEGPKATSDRASTEEGFVPVMDLQPTPAIYSAVTERLIKFPEEQRFSMLPIGNQSKGLK